MPGPSDLGEQALSKAAEIALESQLDESEDLSVELHANPLSLLQGEVESVAIDGKGLVMNKELRTESLSLKTNAIAVDPLKAAFGNIELTHPTAATAQIVLSAADLERAFNSQYIQTKLQNLQIQVNGQPTPIELSKIKFRLPGEKKVALSSDIRLKNTGETRPIAFTAIPRQDPSGDRVILTDIEYQQEQSSEISTALLESAQELLDLRNFELEGMSLKLQQLDVQPEKIVLLAHADVEQFPGE